MFWGPLISSFEDTTPSFSTKKTTIWPLVSTPAWFGVHPHCRVPLFRADGYPFITQNCQCLTVEWNCYLCTTSHFIMHITDLMWWMVISLKRCVNFASRVEQDTVHSASFSSSPVSDGTQMLPCISPSGPLWGEGERGPRKSPGPAPSTGGASIRAPLIWWVLHPDIFFLWCFICY